MARDLARAGSVYRGFNEGRDEEHARQRNLVTEGRVDEIYEHEKAARRRRSALGEAATREALEGIEEERGARDTARRLSAAEPEATTLGEQPQQLGGPGMEEGAETQEGAAPASRAPAELPKALWVRTAEAQRDYWTKQGRPERAQKAMIDAYKNAFAENEARHKFEIQPQEQRFRDLNLTADELAADQRAIGLKRNSITNQLTAAGTLWGLVKMGDTRTALELFNTSSMLQPGVRGASIRTLPARGPDGRVVEVMAIFDQAGEVVKDKNGNELIYPVSQLEAMHRLATTSQVKLKKGESIYQIQQDPTSGTQTATRVIGEDDQTEARNTDTAWSQAINRHTDDAKQYMVGALGLTTNTMGQMLKPENMPLFERAMPKVTAALNQGRQRGLRLDQLNGVELAKEALKEARDELKRENAPGPKGGGQSPSGAAPNQGPSWRDLVGGKP